MTFLPSASAGLRNVSDSSYDWNLYDRVSRTYLLGAVRFAVLHGDPVGMIARVELGALFGLLVLWTGSLWPAIAAHAANNLIGAALLVYTTERPQALSGERGDLAQTVALGLAGALLAGWLLRRSAKRCCAEP